MKLALEYNGNTVVSLSLLGKLGHVDLIIADACARLAQYIQGQDTSFSHLVSFACFAGVESRWGDLSEGRKRRAAINATGASLIKFTPQRPAPDKQRSYMYRFIFIFCSLPEISPEFFVVTITWLLRFL
jgi:hypothetical protein